MLLSQLLDHVKQNMGINHKLDIQKISQFLSQAYPNSYHPNGDDTAAIKTGNGFDLFAGEGFLSAFVEKDPWFAGWCGVMVNVSDITAMGGRPTAIINTYWGKDNDTTQQIFQGMVDASQAFQVPIVGGHTNLQSDKPTLGVSIIGKANRLLSSFSATPEQALIAVVDCRGAYRAPFLNWNAATTAPPERLRNDISLLPFIAENHLADACKDISQAGILGTTVMLLESSQVGAKIDLTKIPKPEEIPWEKWLCSFPSFGYLLTTPKNKVDDLLRVFSQRSISASQIGHITEEKKLIVKHTNSEEIFWDIEKTSFTGMKEKAFTLPNSLQQRA